MYDKQVEQVKKKEIKEKLNYLLGIFLSILCILLVWNPARLPWTSVSDTSFLERALALLDTIPLVDR